MVDASNNTKKREVIYLPETTWAERSAHYTDIKLLLNPGILSESFRLAGQRISMRNLSSSDLFLLNQRASFEDDPFDWQCWVVATSCWIIDGQVLLGDQGALRVVKELISSLAVPVVEKMYQILVWLQGRYSDAVDAVESYCYETESRFFWRGCNGNFQPDEAHTGVPRREVLGFNYVQQMWVGHNRIVDEFNLQQIDRSHALLIAAATDSKGAKKMNESSIQREKERKEKEKSIRDRFFYVCEGLMHPDAEIGGSTLVKSVADLEEEFKNWTEGKFDDHDLVVMAYKEKIRNRYRVRDEEVLAMEVVEHDLSVGGKITEEELKRSQMLVAYTPEEVKDVFGGERSGARQVDAMGNADRLYEKFIKRGTKSAPKNGFRVNAKGEMFRIPDSVPNLSDSVEKRADFLRGTPRE